MLTFQCITSKAAITKHPRTEMNTITIDLRLYSATEALLIPAVFVQKHASGTQRYLK